MRAPFKANTKHTTSSIKRKPGFGVLGRGWSCRRSDYYSFIHLNYFSICLIGLLYLFNHFYLKEVTTNLFIHGYLNDVMAGWFMVAWIQILISLSKYKHSVLINKWFIQLLIVALASLYWEFVAPLYVTGNVSDILDLVAYLAGAVCYSSVLYIIRSTYHGNA